MNTTTKTMMSFLVPSSVADFITSLTTAFGGLLVAYAMFQNYFPYDLRRPFIRYSRKLFNFLYPYIHITFPEFHGNGFERSHAYSAIQRYLNTTSSRHAKNLKAKVLRDSDAIVLTMADQEEVNDTFQGVRLWWASNHILPDRQSISFYPREEEKHEFRLTFHRRHRELVTGVYLRHVLDQGKAITVKERRRKLFTNNKNEGWYGYRRSMWSHVIFEHPATFDTLAMEPSKKKEIMDDLINFTKSESYYKKIGKAWKRGYLLYGPPGTGKSTMIAAMANLLKYDVYDLELTAVKDNTELRKLLIDTAPKSIVVIEDIDCSLDLTGQREKKKKDKDKDEDKKKKDEETDPVKKKMKKMEETKPSQVTLSGLLNFIDGLWSACAGERIIVFTTNYVEKLDPALIRRGRMDKHIELSYCSFDAFKVLARNYLDLEEHEMFSTVKEMLEETKMTPADVAENLMPKSVGEDEELCLKRLVKALEDAKEEEKKKLAEEEEKKKKAAEEEEEEKKKKAAEEEEKAKTKEEKLTKEDNNKKEDEISAKEDSNKKENDHQKSDGVNENGIKENGSVV